MAGNDKAGDILADNVGSTACPKCGHVVDVSNVAAFSNVQCPQCKTAFTAPGRLGQFILLRLLGKGEMGATYKARDKVLGRSVAIKVMKKSLGQDQGRVEHFLAEGRALASLDHPNAVRVFSLGQEKDQPYIVMELITGKSLDKKYSLDKAMDEALALDITIQIGQALEAASKIDLIHGDVKPANIMIGEEGGAKLVDFGIARFGGGQVAEGAVFGTPYYVAPEQVQRGSIDHRTDVYSLGATLFHILGCMPPFLGKTMKEVLETRLKKPAPDLLKIRPSLHRETAAVVARMLQRAPDDRYGDYEELLKDLRHAQSVVTGKAAAPAAVPAAAVPAVAQRPAGVLPAWARTKLGLGIAIGAAVLIIAVGVVLYVRSRGDPKPPGWLPPKVKQVESPVFSPPGRTIKEPLNVSVACDTDGAKIHYTIDGSDPTKSSPVVSGPISVKPGVTLKAKAYLDEWEPSPVAKASYTLHEMTIVEILPVRTSVLAAWENAKQLARGGGMQEKLKQGETLFRTAEELYKQSAYDEAKLYYEKLAAVCKDMEKLDADRKPALDARKAADDAIKALHAMGGGKAPKDPWNKLKTDAVAAFNKGDFAGAVRLWKESAQKAQARKAELNASIATEWQEAEKKYDVERVKKYAAGQWRGVEQMLNQARDHEKKKQFPQARGRYREAVKRLVAADKIAAKAFAEAEKTKGVVKQIDALLKEHKYREALAKTVEGLKGNPKNNPLLTRKKTIEGKLYLTLELKRGGRGKQRVVMKLSLIPPGKFMMGSPKNEVGRGTDEQQYEVNLTKPFYMAHREVTVKQFTVFAEEKKNYKTTAEKSGPVMALRGSQWRIARGMTWRKPDFAQTPDHPVTCVSWDDARAFCAWLSGKTKKKVRLPTEAEWERACRARTTTRFAFGQKDEQLNKHGNYADNSSALLKRDQKHADGHIRTAPVGSFKRNAWGLFDMHGNVAEFCMDMYGPYPRDPVTDPMGLLTGKYPVIRGGSWFDLPVHCRSAVRAQRLRNFSSTNIGFRVVVEE